MGGWVGKRVEIRIRTGSGGQGHMRKSTKDAGD